MNYYRCRGCGTRYSTAGDSPPPGINWSDGHVCKVELEKNQCQGHSEFSDEQEEELWEENEKRMRIIGQNGNTGEHYGKEEANE